MKRREFFKRPIVTIIDPVGFMTVCYPTPVFNTELLERLEMGESIESIPVELTFKRPYEVEPVIKFLEDRGIPGVVMQARKMGNEVILTCVILSVKVKNRVGTPRQLIRISTKDWYNLPKIGDYIGENGRVIAVISDDEMDVILI